MPFLRVNDIVIHYIDEGNKDSPVILFSNSLGTDFRIWDGVVKNLKDNFRVIRYDKRGHGLSSCPEAPYSINDHVKDLTAIIDYLDVRDITVVGLSVGGLIAQGLYSFHPKLIKAIILADTAHKILTKDIWNSRIEIVNKLGLEALADGTMERWFSESYHKKHPENLEGARNMFVRTPVTGYIGTCTAIRDADLTSVAKNINVPVLCLVGSEDGSTPPEVVRETSELIPNSEFYIINDSGHLPCLERPSEFTKLIMNFLNRNNIC
tara:strand:- start:20793 stop:21587 length:795 start_codon:yes stop_codon:yes gene_type:complete